MSCDLITSTSTCHIFKTTADILNFSSVPETTENFIWKECFKGSEATTHFIKQVNMMLDMLNSSNPFAKGYKAPVTKENISLWLKQCDKVLSYFLSLKDQRQKLLIEGHLKTVIWGFTFSIHSLVSIAQEYLSCECCPLQYILTYKFSQDHIELLFNKICHRCRLNNNPNVQQFIYVLRRLLIRNSIEPSNTGNCTHFDDALWKPNGLFDFPSKQNQHQETTTDNNDNDENYSCERMLIQLDQESPSELQDNVLYYLSGFVVRALISKLKCKECIGELLLDPRDPHALTATDYPIHAKFTCFKQNGSLILPSPAVLKIVKAAEVLFKKRDQGQRWRITYERKN